MQPDKRVIVAVLGLAVAVVAAASAQLVLGRPQEQSDVEAQAVWDVSMPKDLRGRLYEMAIIPGQTQVIATSPEAIWRVDERGEFEPLLRLETGGQEGESATLAGDASRVGIFLHRQHAIVGFRLVDLSGEPLATVKALLHFHYRVAPRGDSFVGIGAEGEQIQANAERFLYTFFDDAGKVNAEVRSEEPQPMDSAYTADGGAFVVSNAEGLFAYSIADGELLWNIPKPAKFFAAADTDTGLAVASDAVDLKAVEAHRTGEPLWRFALEQNVRNLTLSPSGEFMLATDGGTAHLLTPESETPLFSYTMPDKDLSINSAVVNDHGVVALGAQRSELNGGMVVILDAGGERMFERELAYELSNAWIPGVQFDLNGVFVLIRTLEELTLVATE